MLSIVTFSDVISSIVSCEVNYFSILIHKKLHKQVSLTLRGGQSALYNRGGRIRKFRNPEPIRIQQEEILSRSATF